MSYLIDTNVLSELRRKQPAPCQPSTACLLAGTALVRGLQMVTRNQKDFDYPGLQTINPWQQTN